MCAGGEPGLDSLRAVAELDGPLREAVHRMKYQDRPQMAAAIVDACRERLPGTAHAVLVPVPLDPERRRHRGYNQAEVLAREIARRTGGEVVDALVRSAGGGSQVGRSGRERRAADSGFEWRPGVPVPAVVVMVDDVVTTGATLQACAAAARAAGVGRVDGLAIARG
jgi:ComF family protein